MEKLKELVKQLENATDYNEQIQILQKINEKLLTKYCIKVGGIEIRPLRVEAYYFNPGKFEDSTVHGSPQQRKFKVLYRHNEKEKIDPAKDNGGVDLCLAYSEKGLAPYFLSFLIKNSWVKVANFEGYCKQIELNKILNERKIKDDTVEIEPRKLNPEEDSTVFHTIRKGLSGKPFGREPLASLIEINRKIEDKDGTLNPIFDFAAGCGKEQILAEYLWKHPEENNASNREKWYGSINVPTWQKNIDNLTKKLEGSSNQ